MGLSLVTISTAFLLTVVLLPLFIAKMRAAHEGQEIREDGPKWHAFKSGTPTMGGAIFNVVILITVSLVTIASHTLALPAVMLWLVFFLYGVIGFSDDFIKLFKKRNMGLTALQKFSAQVLVGLLFIALYLAAHLQTVIPLPFIGHFTNPWLFGAFAIFWFTGFSNAVNLTDGLDGLATGCSIVSYSLYALIAWHDHQQPVLIFCLAVIGALLAFLVFNHKPAKVMMGDVGSLALGAGLAAVSLMLNRPWSLLLLGIIYIIETLSVMLQVASFKLTGKRIFKMSPIHHHFELCGWSEWKIDGVFWGISLIFGLIYLVFAL